MQVDSAAPPHLPVAARVGDGRRGRCWRREEQPHDRLEEGLEKGRRFPCEVGVDRPRAERGHRSAHFPVRVQSARQLLGKSAHVQLARPVVFQSVLQAVVVEGAEAAEVDRGGGAVLLGHHEDDSGGFPGSGGRPDRAIGQKPVYQEPIGQEMHGEHQLVALYGPSCGPRHDAGVQNGDVEPDAVPTEPVAEGMHGPEIREIHPQHRDPVGAGEPLDVFAGIRMAAAARHEDVSAATGQVDRDSLPQPAVGSGDHADLAVDADALRYGTQRFSLREAVGDRAGYRAEDGVAFRGRHRVTSCGIRYSRR